MADPRSAAAAAIRASLKCWKAWAALAVAGLGASLCRAEDPTGLQIDYPFVHLLHSADPEWIGATAHLRRFEPFLLYQLGRDLVLRHYSRQEGAMSQAGRLAVPLYVDAAHGAASPRFARDHAGSCLVCHSMPAREPGAGGTIASTGSFGRNTPHFFGAGLVEMIGEQIRAQILEEFDRNRNGVIDRAEIAAPRPVLVRPAPEAGRVDFGDLAPDQHGIPQLNSLFRIWYLDERGRRLPDALGFDDRRVAAFDFSPQVFGWGRGVRRLAGGGASSQGAESGTLRGIFTQAADFHMGLEAHDPSQLAAGPGGGRAGISLNGARQFDLGEAADRGERVSQLGFSLDDPDRDGVASELSQGDLDAIELYLLHAPPPAFRASAASRQGRRIFLRIGCQRCHVESWQLAAQDPARGLAGDRRLFRLELVAEGEPPRLQGRLVRSWRRGSDGGVEPLRQAARAEGVYSDFKHWDIGPAFWERRFDGSLQEVHRTAPLWGAGSTAPYGHDGRFASLEEAILAHGGAAQGEARAFRRLPAAQRRQLLLFLESLVLYPTDWTPCDIDGDGRIAADFTVAGQRLGFERFDPRFLVSRPADYEVLFRTTDAADRRQSLYRIRDAARLYGLTLPWRTDRDGDGFPEGAAAFSAPASPP